MKTILLKSMLLAAAPLAAFAAMPSIAHAQLAVADLDEAVAKSNAGVLAANQINLTYKAQIDAAQARANTLNTELTGLRNAIVAAQRAPNPNQAAIQAQAAAYQKRQQEAEREVQTLSLPFQTANAYAREQIALKLEAALDRAMTAKRITVVVPPQSVIKALPSAEITADVITQLNALVPTVSTTPPAGWQPGGQGAQGAAPRPAAAAPATPAKPQPQGR
jgi:Skp family chaperone for outer membrane proteins